MVQTWTVTNVYKTEQETRYKKRHRQELRRSCLPFFPPSCFPVVTSQCCIILTAPFEDKQIDAPLKPPHHFSVISTAKLIFHFLLCDIWLTEQRCWGQPSPGEEAEQVGGRKDEKKELKNRGGGRWKRAGAHRQWGGKGQRETEKLSYLPLSQLSSVSPMSLFKRKRRVHINCNCESLSRPFTCLSLGEHPTTDSSRWWSLSSTTQKHLHAFSPKNFFLSFLFFFF